MCHCVWHIHVCVCVCIYVSFTLFHNWWVLGEANFFQSKVCCGFIKLMFSYFLLIVELEVMFDIMIFWPG